MNNYPYYFLMALMIGCTQPIMSMKAPQAEALKAQEKKKEDALGFDTYELTLGTSRKGVKVTASRNLILASPCLQRLLLQRKTVSNKLLLGNEVIECKEALIYLEKVLKSTEKANVIAELSNDQLPNFIKLIIYLQMDELLDLTLETYKKKLQEADQAKKRIQQLEQFLLNPVQVLNPEQAKKPAQSGHQPPSLKQLAAQTIGQNIKEYEDISKLRDPKCLPEEGQKVLVKNIPLTRNNFPMLYAWLKELMVAQNQKDNSKNPTATDATDFSPAQYACLHAVAAFLHDRYGNCKLVVKELCSLDDQQGKVRFALLRWFLRSPDCKFGAANRIKLGWRMALEEKNDVIRDKIFEETAYVLACQVRRRGAHDIDTELMIIPRLLWAGEVPNTPPLFLYKARFKYIYNLLDALKKEPGKGLPNVSIDKDSILLLCKHMTPFSADFLIGLIDEIRDELAQKKPTKEKVALLIELIRYNNNTFLEEQTTTVVRNFKKIEFQKFTIEDMLALLNFLRLPIFQQPQRTGANAAQAEFAEHIQGLILGASDELVHSTCNLLLRGADINTQGPEGNTLAHIALLTRNQKLLHCIGFLNRLGRTIDLHRTNNNGVTPLQLLQSVRFNLDTLHGAIAGTNKLFAFAALTHAELLPKQLKFIYHLGRASEREIVQFAAEIFKRIKRNQVICEIAKWLLSSPVISFPVTERIRIGWLVALKETNEERVAQLLTLIDAVASHITRDENGTLFYKGRELKPTTFPAVLCNKKSVKETFHLVRNLKQCKILLPQALDKMGPFPLIELLTFSQCLSSCLTRIEVNDELTEELLNYASAMNQDPSVVDIALGLILRGADVNAQDAEGNTLVHHTILRGNIVLLELLLDFFGTTLELHKKNQNGCTPLLLAAQHETPEASPVRLLLRQDPKRLASRATDKQKHNAMHYLLARGFGNDPHYINEYREEKLCDCSCNEQGCTALLNALRAHVVPAKVHEKKLPVDDSDSYAESEDADADLSSDTRSDASEEASSSSGEEEGEEGEEEKTLKAEVAAKRREFLVAALEVKKAELEAKKHRGSDRDKEEHRQPAASASSSHREDSAAFEEQARAKALKASKEYEEAVKAMKQASAKARAEALAKRKAEQDNKKAADSDSDADKEHVQTQPTVIASSSHKEASDNDNFKEVLEKARARTFAKQKERQDAQNAAFKEQAQASKARFKQAAEKMQADLAARMDARITALREQDAEQYRIGMNRAQTGAAESDSDSDKEHVQIQPAAIASSSHKQEPDNADKKKKKLDNESHGDTDSSESDN